MKYKKITQRGFTLIELLVVIAIIGILSSVVLASLNTARGKGSDAAIKEDLNNIRAQMELFYDSNGQAYTGGCANPNVTQGIVAALNAGGNTITTLPAANCSAPTSSTWAAWAPLKTTTTSAWCVDSTGQSKVETTAPTAAIGVCP